MGKTTKYRRVYDWVDFAFYIPSCIVILAIPTGAWLVELGAGGVHKALLFPGAGLALGTIIGFLWFDFRPAKKPFKEFLKAIPAVILALGIVAGVLYLGIFVPISYP